MHANAARDLCQAAAALPAAACFNFDAAAPALSPPAVVPADAAAAAAAPSHISPNAFAHFAAARRTDHDHWANAAVVVKPLRDEDSS